MEDLVAGYKFNFYKVLKRGKTVYMGESSNSPHIKTVNKQIRLDVPEQFEKQIAEMLKKHCFSHQNILPILHYFPMKKSMWIITEYCDQGSLLNYLKTNYQSRISYESAADVMLGCAKGLAYLHSLKPALVHGNIHPENIFMTKEGGKHTAKIGDCILASTLSPACKSTTSISGKTYNKCYKAPEYVTDQTKRLPKETLCDIFCMGVVFHALLSYNHEKTKNSSHLLPVLPGDTDGTKKDFVEYITKCHEARSTAVLFNQPSNPNRRLLQLLVGEMVEYVPEKRKPVADVVIGLNRFKIENTPIHSSGAVPDEKLFQKGTAAPEEKSFRQRHSILQNSDERKELDKLVNHFVEKLGRGVPSCIQHLDASEKYFRINVSVDRGKRNTAERFIEEKCPQFCQYIYFTEQPSRPEVSCGRLPGISEVVQPGSVFKANKASDEQESERGIGENFVTLGCFAEDKEDNNMFAITATHGFGHMMGEVMSDDFDSFSAFESNGNVNVVTMSKKNDVFSFYKGHKFNGVPKLVDIAVCQVNNSFKGTRNKNWFIKSAPSANKAHNVVIQGLDHEELNGLKVRKWGARTGYTEGVIVRQNKMMNIHQRFPMAGGVFLVQSVQQAPFSQDGDSGSIVLDQSHYSNGWAVGIVHKRQSNYIEADTENEAVPGATPTSGDVTFCVPVSHCFEAVKDAFGLDLTIVNK